MRYISILLFLLMSACQSTPGGNVTLSEEAPGEDCKEIGQVIGTSNSHKDSREKAMADLRHEASLISGNYVKVVAVSAHGASVRGIAYRCE